MAESRKVKLLEGLRFVHEGIFLRFSHHRHPRGLFSGALEGLLGCPWKPCSCMFSALVDFMDSSAASWCLGVLHTAVPAPLHLTHHVRTVRRTLWPSGDDSLQARCQSCATIWVSAFMLALLISLVWDGYRHLMTRIQSTEFAALGVALFGLLVISFGLALTVPIRSSLARLGEGLVRRRPDLTFLVHPILNLVVAIAQVCF